MGEAPTWSEREGWREPQPGTKGRDGGSPNMEREGGMEGGRRHPFKLIYYPCVRHGSAGSKLRYAAGWAYSETAVSEQSKVM